MIGEIWPLRITSAGKLRVIRTYEAEPQLRFIVLDVKIRPRRSGVVGGFVLLATTTANSKIEIPLMFKITRCKTHLTQGVEYRKGEGIGPFDAVFEILEQDLNITGEVKDWLRRTSFRLVVKTDRHPATRQVKWEGRK